MSPRLGSIPAPRGHRAPTSSSARLCRASCSRSEPSSAASDRMRCAMGPGNTGTAGPRLRAPKFPPGSGRASPGEQRPPPARCPRVRGFESRAGESLCHSVGQAGKDRAGSPGPASLLKQGRPRAPGTGLQPDGAGIFPVMETPRPFWAACFVVAAQCKPYCNGLQAPGVPAGYRGYQCTSCILAQSAHSGPPRIGSECHL